MERDTLFAFPTQRFGRRKSTVRSCPERSTLTPLLFSHRLTQACNGQKESETMTKTQLLNDQYPYEATWKQLTPQQQREVKRRAKQAGLPLPAILATDLRRQQVEQRIHRQLAAEPAAPVFRCEQCQQQPTAPQVSYVRVLNLRAPVPSAYESLPEKRILSLVERDQVQCLQMVLDYDRVVDWARTTTLEVVGLARRRENHPLQRYLHETYQVRKGSCASCRLYQSACEAFKGIPHVVHTRHIPVCVNPHLLAGAEEACLTLYCPLPSWTKSFLARLETLPNGGKITREMLCTLLRATR
jgi:hypothetical protein